MVRTSMSLLSSLWARWEGLIGFVFKPFLTDKPLLASSHRSRPRSRTFLLLSTLVLLITAPLAYLSLSYLKPAQAVWFDDSFAYRQKLTFGNTGAADTNKKVKFDIDTASLTTDKLQADCDDIRFTDINGKLLKHYLDAAGGACDTASTDYYVLVPTIHAGSTVLYMYYGNPSAVNGGQSAQFSEGTFTPTSGPTASSEEEAPGPTAQWKLDEGAGSTAQDATLQNNDGSISGATWMTKSECVSGTCLSFDGTNDVVTVANTVAGIQTVSFWVRPSTTSEQYIDINGSAYIQTSSGTISTTGFTDPTIYVNGVVSSTIEAHTWQYVTVTTGTPLSGSAIKLGQISTNYGKIILDEVKLYPYVRSTAQIRLDYTNASASEGGTALGAQSDSFLSNGLAGYWKMDVSSGNVGDSSGNATTLSNSGTTTFVSGKYGNGSEHVPASSQHFAPTSISDTSSGPLSPGTIVDHAGVGTMTWQNPSNAGASDNSDTTVTSATVGTSHYLKATNFGFAIPTGATINGITAEIERSSDSLQYSVDSALYIVKADGTLGSENKADTGTNWPGSDTYKTYGGSTDDWNETWSATDINDADFGVALSVTDNNVFFSFPANTLVTTARGDVPIQSLHVGDTLVTYDEEAQDISSSEILQLHQSIGLKKLITLTSTLGQKVTATDNHTFFTDTGWVEAGELAVGDTVFLHSGNTINPVTISSISSKEQYETVYNLSLNEHHTYFANGFLVHNTAYVDHIRITVHYTAEEAVSLPNIKTVSFWANPDSTTNYFASLSSSAYITSSAGTLSATGFTDPTIYVNGVEGATIVADTWQLITVTTETGVVADQVYIGRQGSNYYDGTLDEVRVYSRAFAADEVASLYKSAPGPVGEWKLDEKSDGSGSVTRSDTSGNNNNLSDSTTVASHVGKFASSADFSGVNEFLNITDASQTSLDITGPITIEGWVNPEAVGVGNQFFASKALVKDAANDSLGYACGVYQSGASLFPRFILSSAGTTLDGSMVGNTVVPVGTWTHLTCIYDGTSMKTFVNGRLDATIAYSSGIFNNAGDFSIGGQDYTGGGGVVYDFNGKVDTTRIYNYARTQSQVIQDMNAGHPLGGSPIGSQVAHWKLDEGYGTSANDSSINSNTLTLSSATSAWSNSGKYDKAWNGDGALYMSRADDADFDFTDSEDFSISGWVKSDSASNPGAIEYIFNKAAASTAGYAVYFNTSGFLCFGIDDDTSWGPDISSCSTTDVYDGTWHHFLAVRDYSGSDKTLVYIDGKLHDSDSDTTTATLANSLSLYVGDRDGTNNGDEFNGDIDEIKVYRAALSASEALIDYTQGSSTSLGAISDNSTYEKSAANQAYCVPGDATSCAAPVVEWKFDEKTGTSAYDTSGNANTGTISGQPSWAPGKLGSGLTFDGNDDIVSNTSLPIVLRNSSTFTVSFWAAADSYNPDRTALSLNYSGINIYSMNIYPFDSHNGNGARVYYNGTNIIDNNSDSLADGKYHHFVFRSVSSTEQYLYIDGVVSGSSTTSKALMSSLDQFNVGSWKSNSQFFPGKIDHVVIYDYARTPAQIAWEYNRGKPVAHYKFDECSGTTANDATGNGFSGTITPGASGNTAAGTCSSGVSTDMWNDGTTGKYNSSLGFDGTDDYVTVTHNAALTPTADYTLSAWVNTTSSNTEQEVITKFTASGSYPGYLLSVGNAVGGNTGKVCLWVGDLSSGWTCGTSAINDGTWHHVVGQLSGTTVNIYVDGKLEIAATRSPSRSTSSNLEIGRRSDTGAYFPGLIDDVRIYTYALTAAQIRNVMNEGSAVRFGPATGQP